MTHRPAHRSVFAFALPILTASTVALASVATAVPAGAASPVAPSGTITLLEHGAWSWFEDARATFDPDGSSLLVSGVAGSGAEDVAPGTVVLSQVDVATGARTLVDLGHAEVDDHNSASIDAGPSGEVLTSWARHNLDNLVNHQRRRTDMSWLRLPPTDLGARTTYANLRRAADAEGNPILYDFVRGARFDPTALASVDEGRTWANLGPVLRDPADGVNVRPYVQYADPHNGRIHLVATEAHPDQSATSIYHGYIEGGRVYSSTGQVLGALGSGVSVTSLTRVWQASTAERGWSTDIEVDPANGQPVITFSVTRDANDHRYRYARWNGLSWTTEEIAHAGTALFPDEEHYTGLATIDPADPTRVVVSTDAHPENGSPLVSGTGGQRHWELWEGRRDHLGGWTWRAITSDSTEDNLRPLLVAHPGGASALVWLRGTYSSYLDYDLAVVAQVRRADASLVPGVAPAWTPAVDVLRNPAATSTLARPVVGSFDGHQADDVYFARAGSSRDDLLLGDEQRHPSPVNARAVFSSAVPVGGDFDADGRTDILWYMAGSGSESLWKTTGIGTFTPRSTRQVSGTYQPVPGDYDGDGDSDIYWYAKGKAPDNLWRATPSGFVASVPSQANGTYVPVPGDFNGDGRTDILWYAPGAAADHLWTATTNGFSSSPRLITGSYTPIPGDHDGDGADDVLWYAPGPATDFLWWSSDGPLASSEVAAVNL